MMMMTKDMTTKNFDLGVYTFNEKNAAIQVDTVCVHRGPDGYITGIRVNVQCLSYKDLEKIVTDLEKLEMVKGKCYLRFSTLSFIPKEPYDVIATDYDNYALVSGAKDKSFIQLALADNQLRGSIPTSTIASKGLNSLKKAKHLPAWKVEDVKKSHIASDFQKKDFKSNPTKENKTNSSKDTCFECGKKMHFKKDCYKLRNKKKALLTWSDDDFDVEIDSDDKVVQLYFAGLEDSSRDNDEARKLKENMLI
ncbi:hypothetical protein AgCh_028310 [Apium graveolens]